MASLGSKSPTSRYTTSWALEVYKLLLRRLAVTTNASGTLGSGTCVQPGGIGKVKSSALKFCACCASRWTFLPAKKSRSVPELAGSIVGCGGAAAAAGAGGMAGLAGASADETGEGAPGTAATIPGMVVPACPGATV